MQESMPHKMHADNGWTHMTVCNKRLYLYMEVAKLGNAISPKVITTKFPLDNLIYSLKPSFCQEDFIF